MNASGETTAPARRFGTRRVATLMGRIIDPAARARGFAEVALLADWAGIVGPGLAGRCRPMQIRFERGRRAGGTLILQAGGGAALELQHAAPQILERINRYFGFPAVRSLRFLPTPLWAPPRATSAPARVPLEPHEAAAIASAVAPVTDPGLREALERLGRTVRGRAPPARGLP